MDKRLNKINYSPEIGDVIRVILYPNNFFVYKASNPQLDISLKVYNEFLGCFNSTVYPVGKITEVFKHTKTKSVWVGVHNRLNDIVYNVPVKNIIEKII